MSKKEKTEEQTLLEQAGADLIRKVRDAEPDLTHEAITSWCEIEKQFPLLPARRKIRIFYWPVAASIILLFSVGIYFWMNPKDESALALALLENEESYLTQDEILLIGQAEKMQLKDDSSIEYDADGHSNLEEHIVIKEETEDKKPPKDAAINQIMVPKGKRASITFSDGTKMFINAGTRVFYPAVFSKDKREILVEGEVFLEVRKDVSRPFIVKTSGFDVRVLGTQFNVSAYKEDPSATVVLVDGEVEVAVGKNEKSLLAPNQMIEINAQGSNIKEVDVLEYICWKDNMMLLKGRTTGEVLNRLSRYYDQKIIYDADIEDIPISGKLDLREEVMDAIRNVCQPLYLQYKLDEDNNIII